MSDSITNDTAPQYTTFPAIVCVDVHGDRVPEHSRDVPEITPDPTDPADWPAWVDNWFWGTTEGPDEPPDGPDGDAWTAFPGAPPLAERLAPIVGGAPGEERPFEPSEGDWQDYRDWCEEVDRREELKALEDRCDPMWGYE
jgi:hypothetical protein